MDTTLNQLNPVPILPTYFLILLSHLSLRLRNGYFPKVYTPTFFTHVFHLSELHRLSIGTFMKQVLLAKNKFPLPQNSNNFIQNELLFQDTCCTYYIDFAYLQNICFPRPMKSYFRSTQKGRKIADIYLPPAFVLWK